jgi:hypothetical protein
MPPMPRRRALAALAFVAALAMAAPSGCGGGSDSSTDSSQGTAESRPAPPKSDFPSAEGKTLAQVVEEAAGPSTLVVSPAAKAFYEGPNRYPFGVFERDGSQVGDAKVALYFARVPLKKGTAAGTKSEKDAFEESLEQPALGPYPAALETVATKPAFRAMTTTSDPDAATGVYHASVDFPRDGEWRIVALVEEGGELQAVQVSPSASVGTFARIPRPGEKAPLIHTPTPEDVGGDLSKITTRIPPGTQNEVDYADVLGKEPIVLLFATPQFCQSRVCGPVADVTEQVKQLYGDKAKFIHMEIYNDNDPNEGVRPQVRAFHLPSEPWLFAIDQSGRIEAEIEGAFGVEELTSTVKGLTGE